MAHSRRPLIALHIHVGHRTYYYLYMQYIQSQPEFAAAISGPREDRETRRHIYIVPPADIKSLLRRLAFAADVCICVHRDHFQIDTTGASTSQLYTPARTHLHAAERARGL